MAGNRFGVVTAKSVKIDQAWHIERSTNDLTIKDLLNSNVIPVTIKTAAPVDSIYIGAGGVGIWNNTPDSKLTIGRTTSGAQPSAAADIHIVGLDGSFPGIYVDAFGAAPYITGRRAQGTNAAKTAATSGISLLRIQASGYKATGYSSDAVSIDLISDGIWTDTSVPTAITFKTVTSGSTTLTERMKIDNAGRVNIGGTLLNSPGKLEVIHSDAAIDTVFGQSVNTGLRMMNTNATVNNFTHITNVNSQNTLSSMIAFINGDHSTPNTIGHIDFITRSGATLNRPMRLLGDGTIGIGTAATTAGSKLDIRAPGSASIGVLHIVGIAAPGSGNKWLTMRDWTNTSTFFYIDDFSNMFLTGSFGINTTAPQTKLHVHNTNPDTHIYLSDTSPSIKMGNNVVNGSSTASFMMALATVGGHYSLPNAGDTLIGNWQASRGNLYITANYSGAGTKHIVMQSYGGGGSVGIGALPTGALLDVFGNGRFLAQVPTTGAVIMRANASNQPAYMQWVNNGNTIERGWLVVDEASSMLFATVSTERMRIDNLGNVGIGATPSGIRLHAQYADTSGVGFRVHQTSASGFTSEVAQIIMTQANNATSNLLSIYSSGGADYEFKVRGDGLVFSDGGTAMSTPADYAEMFEWADGNPYSEDRVGMTVALIGNKIKVAGVGDAVFGVVSGNPAVIGDAAWNKWSEKYLKDEFNRYLRNSKGDRILNPEYDPKASYTSRTERKEWSPIGLMGKLRVKKGQVLNPNWTLMRGISQNVSEYLIGTN